MPTLPAGTGNNAIQQIRELLAKQPDSPRNTLYDQARDLLEAKRFAEAEPVVRTLLGLYPDDGEGWLLYAKGLINDQRWDDALAALAAAERCGVAQDISQIRQRLIAVKNRTQATPANQVTDDQLQAELRRERNAHDATRRENEKLERDNQRWALVSIVVGALTLLLFFYSSYTNTSAGVAASEPPATESTAATPAATQAPVAASSTPSTPPPSTKPAVSSPAPSPSAAPAAPAESPDAAHTREATALLTERGLNPNNALSVSVRGDKAILVGKAASAHQISESSNALKEGLSSIKTIDTSGVINLARRDGTKHKVVSGDSLGAISLYYYGTILKDKEIIAANPILGGKNNLSLDQVLVIPPLPESDN